MGLRDTLMVKLWESITPGETVLLERSGEGDVTTGVYHTISWAKSKNFDVVVVDVFDSYSTILSKAILVGLGEDIFEDIRVIKIGGTKKHENVISHIQEITEPIVLIRKFKEAYSPIIQNSKRTVLTIVVGLEKLFVASNLTSLGAQEIVNNLGSYVGNRGRLGVYLLKVDILPQEKDFVIKLLEDLATTVIKTQKIGRLMEFHIVKSLNRDLEGVLIRV